MAEYIYASTLASGVDRVRLPGDPERNPGHANGSGREIDPNSWRSALLRPKLD